MSVLKRPTSAKRGLFAIFAAKLFFMVAGYALYFWLGRLLSVESFGLYGVLFAVVSVVNMVVVNGTMQTISHFVATHPAYATGIRRRGFSYQAVVVVLLIGGSFVAAPFGAAFLHDESLTELFRVSALISAIYALYSINVGYLNGKKRFVRQAALDVTFATLKVGAILTLAALGFGLYGVVFGFAGAALAILLISFAVAGGRVSGEAGDISAIRFLTYAASVTAVAMLLNLVLNADLLLIKRLADVTVANTLAAHYTAAQSIARIPYALMITVTLVLFPVMASMNRGGAASERVRRETTSRAMSMIATALAGMVAVVAPIATDVVLVLYQAPFAPAGPVLAVLVGAVCLLTLLNVGITIVSGAGRPIVSAGVLLLTLTVQLAGGLWLIPQYGARGAALATTAGAATGLVATLLFLRVMYGTRIRAWSILVTVLCAGAVVALGLSFRAAVPAPGKVLTVLYCGAAYLLYLALVGLGGVLLGMPARRDRILWVTKPLDPPFNDGAKVLPRTLLTYLDNSRVTVCVSRSVSPADWPAGVEAVKVYSAADSFVARSSQNLRVFAYLLIARFHYRTVHFFFAPNRTTCRAVRLLKAISPGVQFVQTVMSRPASFEDASGLLFGDVVIAQSEQTRRRLTESTGRADIVLMRPPTEVAERVSADTASAGRTLLFAGDIDHGGALTHLAEIVPALLESQPQLRFDFSVRVKGPDTLARAQVFFDTHLARFGDRVELHVDHPEFGSLLERQDLMIFPAEDLYAKVDAPLVVLETMARGKPVFLLDREPLSEIPGPDLSALLVGEDAAALVRLIEQFLETPELIPADALRDVVNARFSARGAAATLERLYAGT